MKRAPTSVEGICERAKRAAYDLGETSDERIEGLLEAVAAGLESGTAALLEANRVDMEAARRSGMAEGMLDRLMLNKERIAGMARDVRRVAALPSPVGQTLEVQTLYNGIRCEKRSVPFGVIAIIYESRPNVTLDASVIALKAKNAVVLRGGKEAIVSNTALVDILKRACTAAGVPEDVIGFVPSVDRRDTLALLKMKGTVDVLIPRGSASLIQWVSEHARIPVIETGAGNCHVYVHASADEGMALEIIENAKVQRPSVCNAVEKVLVDRKIAPHFIPILIRHLGHRVAFRVDEGAAAYVQALAPDEKSDFNIAPMSAEERGTEYLEYTLGIVVVEDVRAAIEWINRYSTHHSDGIITSEIHVAKRFQAQVDSAAVYHNASTRFTDGGEFGFGAEIGIATGKLHARGPMGLKEMTTYKYILTGDGQIRR